MRPPPTRSGGPGLTPGTAANAHKIAALITGPHRKDSLPVAFGEYHGPAGRRRLGVVIVRRCPRCSHLHLHRAQMVGTADGSTRTGSCGSQYVLRVLPVQRIYEDGAAMGVLMSLDPDLDGGGAA